MKCYFLQTSEMFGHSEMFGTCMVYKYIKTYIDPLGAEILTFEKNVSIVENRW